MINSFFCLFVFISILTTDLMTVVIALQIGKSIYGRRVSSCRLFPLYSSYLSSFSTSAHAISSSLVSSIPSTSSTMPAIKQRSHTISPQNEKYIDEINQRDLAQALRDDLRKWRKSTAQELNKEPYHIFPNKVLDYIVSEIPINEAAFKALPGVGPKISEYGPPIIAIVGKYVKQGLISKPKPIDVSVENTKAIKKVKVKKVPPQSISTISSGQSPQFGFGDYSSFYNLNEEQNRCAQKILAGQSKFVTGSAGTGKSYLLRCVIGQLKELHGGNAVAVTAPTGVAAINIGGQTVHSFAGIGIGTLRTQQLIEKVKRSKQAVDRWLTTEVLIIDEISMLSKDLFESLDAIAKSIRKRSEPFGGIQLVLVGDFMQLPPIGVGVTTSFCFHSEVWKSIGLSSSKNVVVLKQMCRQSDGAFVDILNSIRCGQVTQSLLSQLDNCLVTKKPRPVDGIKPTVLYCTNKDVDSENKNQLEKINHPSHEMVSTDQWSTPVSTASRKAILESMEKVIPSVINLKIGAQVMLLRNRPRLAGQSSGLVNGSRGVVIRFEQSFINKCYLPVVRFDNGEQLIIGPIDFSLSYYIKFETLGTLTRSQVPLRLAWATTVHKGQGMTLTRAELMVSNAFDYGQVYVALSRLTSLDGLWLTQPIRKESIKVHPDVVKYYKDLTISEETENEFLVRTMQKEKDTNAPLELITESEDMTSTLVRDPLWIQADIQL